MGSPGVAKLNEILELMVGLIPPYQDFQIFFWIFLGFKLSISQNPCILASGGTWNVKIIESLLSIEDERSRIPLSWEYISDDFDVVLL